MIVCHWKKPCHFICKYAIHLDVLSQSMLVSGISRSALVARDIHAQKCGQNEITKQKTKKTKPKKKVHKC